MCVFYGQRFANVEYIEKLDRIHYYTIMQTNNNGAVYEKKKRIRISATGSKLLTPESNAIRKKDDVSIFLKKTILKHIIKLAST